MVKAKLSPDTINTSIPDGYSILLAPGGRSIDFITDYHEFKSKHVNCIHEEISLVGV